MKTVLVATDFSSAANNACMYAMQFAKAIQAKIIFYHAFRFLYPPAGSLVITSAAELKENCEEELQHFANELNEKFGGNNNIETVVEDTSRIAEAIVAKAEEKDAFMIFLGMKSTGKGIRKMFGSTATALSHYCPIPLLVVPEKATYTAPRVITLANDITGNTDLSILDPLKEIGNKFSSKLLIVRVIKNKREELFERQQRPRILKYYLPELDPEYVFTVNENVPQGLAKCVEEFRADMVVMIPHSHNLFERLFERSYTNEMLFHTSVPVLILQDRLNGNAKEGSFSATFDREDYFAIE